MKKLAFILTAVSYSTFCQGAPLDLAAFKAKQAEKATGDFILAETVTGISSSLKQGEYKLRFGKLADRFEVPINVVVTGNQKVTFSGDDLGTVRIDYTTKKPYNAERIVRKGDLTNMFITLRAGEVAAARPADQADLNRDRHQDRENEKKSRAKVLQ